MPTLWSPEDGYPRKWLSQWVSASGRQSVGVSSGHRKPWERPLVCPGRPSSAPREPSLLSPSYVAWAIHSLAVHLSRLQETVTR